MLKLGDTIFHRITGKEYKIAGYFTLEGLYQTKSQMLTRYQAVTLSRQNPNKVFVEFECRLYDTWANVNSNLYMSEDEHKSYLSTFQKWEDRDLVPNPR